MYPFIRLAKEFFKFRNAPRLALTETHVSHHICWPWDLDFYLELNNGRTLTIYDLSRIPLAWRAGLIKGLRDNGWGLAVAGASVRYRRRVKMFQKVEIRSRCVCWDDRFIYLEQSMWIGDECASHILIRAAVTGKGGIVPAADVVEAVSPGHGRPAMPDWIAAWVEAENHRPWPPE